jgi:hypothetical protein
MFRLATLFRIRFDRFVIEGGSGRVGHSGSFRPDEAYSGQGKDDVDIPRGEW